MGSLYVKIAPSLHTGQSPMTPTSPRLRASQPAVIAHRGVPERRPENTLASFALALEEGADGIELDVHLSADGQVVVHHDDAIRVPGTDVRKLRIAEHSMSSLRSICEVELPALAEVLELVGQKARVWVEIKGQRVEREVVAVIRSGHSACAIHAFDHRAIRRASELAPEIPYGLLMVARTVDPVSLLRAAGATALWQEWSMIDEELVSEIHAAGGEVVAWTVNDVETAAALASIDVDAICTDRPGRLRASLYGSD